MNQDKAFTPVRIQRSRKVKQVSPNLLPIQYVGRPGKWGNPYKIGGEHGLTTIDQILEAYKLTTEVKIGQGWLNISELKGKNLSCWCPIGDPCHADVLLELANK